jgi:isopenicillin N synthase-like dioxygenase
LAHAPPYARLLGPNMWPSALPGLQPVIEEWQAAVIPAAHKLLRAWALSLGAAEDFFDRHFSEPSTRLKIVRYPATEATENEQPTIGVGPHKDGGCVTLLWVQSGTGGLQIQPAADGPWIDAPPLDREGAFVCNIGEMVELATGGYLKATVHRVLSQPRERISVPMFFNPSLDAQFPTLTLPDHLAEQARRAGRSVAQDPNDRIHAVYGNNLLKSRLRAHPDVAAAHHPDLVESGAY